VLDGRASYGGIPGLGESGELFQLILTCTYNRSDGKAGSGWQQES
jgi:hypothetical protein